MTNCHECRGQMPDDHAAWCSTGRIAELQDENARLRAVLEWYATVPRDEDGATMPLDCGERARTALQDKSIPEEPKR